MDVLDHLKEAVNRLAEATSDDRPAIARDEAKRLLSLGAPLEVVLEWVFACGGKSGKRLFRASVAVYDALRLADA